MKQLVIAGLLISMATGANAASCSALQNQINSLMAQAQNADGICQAAQIEVQLFQAAGDYNWYCAKQKAQAQEYYNDRDQAQATANASCS